MTRERGTSTVRQEAPEIAGRAVVVAAIVIVLVSLSAVGAMTLILQARAGRFDDVAPEASLVRPSAASPIERSEIRETAHGQFLQDKARRRLDEWGWVERGKVARIPIDEAARSLVRDAREGRLEWPDREARPRTGTGTTSAAPSGLPGTAVPAGVVNRVRPAERGGAAP